MLTSLEIQNFKAFRHLKMEKLAKVNLFVGEGNTGKTTVLEALSCLGKPESFSNWSPFRRYPSNPPIKLESEHDSSATPTAFGWWVKFAGVNSPSIKPRITAMQANGYRIRVPSKYPAHSPPVRRLVLPQISKTAATPEPYSKIAIVPTNPKDPEKLAKEFDLWTAREGLEDRFVHFVQSVDNRVKALRAKQHTGVHMVYASVGMPELIPLNLLGEGLNRLIEIYGAIIGEDANIVLIDEIENGLHWKALPKVWQGIKAVVDVEDVQIFATTHSIECIQAASEVFKGPPDDFAVHRLERRDDGEIHCITMDEETLGRMLERGWEVR